MKRAGGRELKKGFSLFVIIIFIFGFAGCARRAVKTTEGGGASEALEEKASGGEGGLSEETVVEEPLGGEAVMAKKAGEEEAISGIKEKAKLRLAEGISDVYFDFDRYEIKSDERAALEKSARVLKEDKKIKILIEGHADERGSSEYNIALGERRADAAKKYLVNLGVDSRRMSTVSYGKEKPFCFDSTEECWQENRRAHFVISD